MAAEALYSARLDSGTPIHVDSVSLMRSFLRPGEAAYLRLARIPLDERAPE